MTQCPTCLAAGQAHEAHPTGRRVGRDVESFPSALNIAGKALKHHHTDTPSVTHYECSNGHQWSEETHHPCWCQKGNQ